LGVRQGHAWAHACKPHRRGTHARK
jgi:hypothetical protein